MRTAIITGASAGLGKEYVKQVIKQYPDIEELWLVARRTELLEQVKSEVSDKLSVKLISMDLNQRESISLFDKHLKESNPQLLLLINNAGFGKLGYVWELEPEVQRSMADLNCGVLAAVTALCIPYMKQKSGILNVCSIASFAPTPRMTVYSATKSFVMTFSRGLREELKEKGINVLAVCPGPMSTEFLSRANIGKGQSKTFDTLPYCDPQQVAEKSLVALRKGKAVYTNKFLYKLYRVIGKLAPKSIMMKFTKC